METKPFSSRTLAKTPCWMTPPLSRGPIIVYPKQPQMSTRVSLRNLDASATRVRTIRGFSKISLNCRTAHLAKIFKIINSLGNPTTWTQISIQDRKVHQDRARSWARPRTAWACFSQVALPKPVQICPVSNRMSHHWASSRITVIELLESIQPRYTEAAMAKAVKIIKTKALSYGLRTRQPNKASSWTVEGPQYSRTPSSKLISQPLDRG